MGYKNVERIYVLEPRMNMNGLYSVQDDHGIKEILSKINAGIDVVEFFANREIDALVFAQDILTMSYDPTLDESGATNEVNDHDNGNQLAYNLNEDVEINFNHSDRHANEEDNEDESDDNDGNEIPNERKELVCFNIDDQRPYFSLDMTFSNAFIARESISRYVISKDENIGFDGYIGT